MLYCMYTFRQSFIWSRHSKLEVLSQRSAKNWGLAICWISHRHKSCAPTIRVGKILSNYSNQYAPFHKANQRLSVEARAKYRCDTSVIADNDSKGRYPKMCSHTSAGSCSIATAHSGRGVRVTLRASSIFSYNWWLYTPPQGWDSYP